MSGRSLDEVLSLCLQSEAVLVATLSEAAAMFDAPSLLPEWSRSHLVAHLAGNAAALTNLLTWARSGVVTPMYESPEARQQQIDTDSQKERDWLIGQFLATSSTLIGAMQSLPRDAWAAQVQTAQGRLVTAAEIPWMRLRESAIHLVDLDLGVGFDALPSKVVDLLLDEITVTLSARPGCPAVALTATDRPHTWQVGPEDATQPHELRATAAELLAWVAGRQATLKSTVSTIALPRWL